MNISLAKKQKRNGTPKAARGWITPVVHILAEIQLITR